MENMMNKVLFCDLFEFMFKSMCFGHGASAYKYCF